MSVTLSMMRFAHAQCCWPCWYGHLFLQTSQSGSWVPNRHKYPNLYIKAQSPWTKRYRRPLACRFHFNSGKCRIYFFSILSRRSLSYLSVSSPSFCYFSEPCVPRPSLPSFPGGYPFKVFLTTFHRHLAWNRSEPRTSVFLSKTISGKRVWLLITKLRVRFPSPPTQLEIKMERKCVTYLTHVCRCPCSFERWKL
jgi:hypothetical protein